MLSTYAIVGPYGNANARDHAELGRYVRFEYGGTMSVEAFLAAAMREAKGPETGWRRRIVDGFRVMRTGLRALGLTLRGASPAEEA